MLDPTSSDIDQETIYIDEKTNATIAADGTYSITPQLYAGMIEADQLKKIGEIVDKYSLSPLSITNEQQITIQAFIRLNSIKYVTN
ncbi:assimilatory nitrite reductase [Gracilibacillus halophilus YIM-C55.5]|uniref:Assimilatory nitrite reductase n=1 Tax=Gracilibacillus halophilus YIM-C55.5 TaxID=1308866 RepID=N4WA36_9BACI|nr:assimilatory nitrite reductase [Gracilibacillus halophilus YIM-C55.5]